MHEAPEAAHILIRLRYRKSIVNGILSTAPNCSKDVATSPLLACLLLKKRKPLSSHRLSRKHVPAAKVAVYIVFMALLLIPFGWRGAHLLHRHKDTHVGASHHLPLANERIISEFKFTMLFSSLGVEKADFWTPKRSLVLSF